MIFDKSLMSSGGYFVMDFKFEIRSESNLMEIISGVSGREIVTSNADSIETSLTQNQKVLHGA